MRNMLMCRGLAGTRCNQQIICSTGHTHLSIKYLIKYGCFGNHCVLQKFNTGKLASRPLGLLLCPTVSGGHDILLGDQFRTKLTYTSLLLHARVELGCKKKQKFYRDLQPSSTLVCSRMYIGSVERESSRCNALHPMSQNFEESFLPASYVDY